MEIHLSARKHGIADDPKADDAEGDSRKNSKRRSDHRRAGAELAEKAEAGHDVDDLLRRRGGRPPLGSAPATVESVRLDPELRDALVERARRDDETPSSVIRKALRKYLDVA